MRTVSGSPCPSLLVLFFVVLALPIFFRRARRKLDEESTAELFSGRVFSAEEIRIGTRGASAGPVSREAPRPSAKDAEAVIGAASRLDEAWQAALATRDAAPVRDFVAPELLDRLASVVAEPPAEYVAWIESEIPATGRCTAIRLWGSGTGGQGGRAYDVRVVRGIALAGESEPRLNMTDETWTLAVAPSSPCCPVCGAATSATRCPYCGSAVSAGGWQAVGYRRDDTGIAAGA